MLLGQVGQEWQGPHRWKMTASTVMAASKRKAKAPRMEPITKDSFSGSWEDSSPEGPALGSQRSQVSHKIMCTHPTL